MSNAFISNSVETFLSLTGDQDTLVFLELVASIALSLDTDAVLSLEAERALSLDTVMADSNVTNSAWSELSDDATVLGIGCNNRSSGGNLSLDLSLSGSR